MNLPFQVEHTSLPCRLTLRARLQRARRPRLSIWGSEEGTAMVEFALSLLLFLILLFGFFTFALVLNNYIELSYAVQAEATALATNRAAGTGPPTACSLAITALDNAAGNLKTSQITTNLSTLSPNPFPSPDTSTCSSLAPGDNAIVEASYPCNLQVIGLNFWKGKCTLKVTTAIRIE